MGRRYVRILPLPHVSAIDGTGGFDIRFPGDPKRLEQSNARLRGDPTVSDHFKKLVLAYHSPFHSAASLFLIIARSICRPCR